MPLCGFNKKMIHGIAIFSEGLFEATIDRGTQNGQNGTKAIEVEIREIALFIKALQDEYGITVETSKKIAEMIYGIAVFSGALFESTLARNENSKDGLKATFEHQVRTISAFLEELENKHQDLKKTNTPEQTMIKAVEWIDENDTALVSSK